MSTLQMPGRVLCLLCIRANESSPQACHKPRKAEEEEGAILQGSVERLQGRFCREV